MDGRRGRPTTPPKQRRNYPVQVLLTKDEKAAALRMAGAVPLATWVYGLVKREMEKE